MNDRPDTARRLLEIFGQPFEWAFGGAINRISAGVYRLALRWTREPGACDAELLEAWRKGAAELHARGAALENQPLILITGLRGSGDAAALLSAAGYVLEYDGSDSPGALQWFLARSLTNANERVVFLALNGVSSLSALSSSMTHRAGGPTNSTEGARPDSPAPASVSVSVDGATERSSRLRQTAELLRRSRRPAVPINGWLIVVPFSLLNESAADPTALKTAFRNDIENLAQRMELKASATVLVTGLDEHRGFLELVKRLDGFDRSQSVEEQDQKGEGESSRAARGGRFGKGGDATTIATAEFVDAVVSNACGLFEDRTLMMFRGREGLANPTGNRRLYSLVCTIRSRIQPALAEAVHHGFCGDEEKSGTNRDLVRLGGCYFAKLTKEPAFVRSVFEKIESLVDAVSWTESALRVDDRYCRLARVVSLVNAAAVAALFALAVWNWVLER